MTVYDLTTIHKFIVEYFSDQDLDELCLAYFPDVYNDFTVGMGKRKKVTQLVDYCQRRGQMPNLMAALKRERETLYQKHFATQQALHIEPSPAHMVVERNPRQVFISYAHEDAKFARQLAHDLMLHGLPVWIAPISIRPGEKWVEAINRGLEESGVFALVLTAAAVNSHWVRFETSAAIEMEREGEIRVIPLEVERSRVPPMWRVYQQIPFRAEYETGLLALLSLLKTNKSSLLPIRVGDSRPLSGHAKTETGIKQLSNSNKSELAALYEAFQLLRQVAEKASSEGKSLSAAVVKTGMITRQQDFDEHQLKDRTGRNFSRFVDFVRAAEAEGFVKVVDRGYRFEVHPSNVVVWHKDGKEMVRVPAGEFLYGENKEKVYLPEFWIDKTPVTNAEYARFVAASGHRSPDHWKGQPRAQHDAIADHPVDHVSWDDVIAYAVWAGKRLSSEEEWEKAARGTDGREYPWGNEDPTDELCNMGEKRGSTTPVGCYSPQGDSPYGCVDMSGNVWEWTDSWYDDRKTARVVRGGSWSSHYRSASVLSRAKQPLRLNGASVGLGFRLVSKVG